MNAKSHGKNIQPTLKADKSSDWQNHIVEELSSDAMAAVSGGAPLVYQTDPAERLRLLSTVVGG